AGAMLLYTHFIWSFDLDSFFGPDGWLPTTFMSEVHQETNGGPDAPSRLIWSHFDYIQSPTLMRAVHFAALVVFLLLTIGLFSRTVAVLAFLLAVSYANRVTPGAY